MDTVLLRLFLLISYLPGYFAEMLLLLRKFDKYY